MREYLLTMKNGTREYYNAVPFHHWCQLRNEKVGLTFKARLEQFRRYTAQDVVDWELED